jgi:hypothetical protein
MPELELLQRAGLCITRGGLNAALECLSRRDPREAEIVGRVTGVTMRLAEPQA